VRPAIDLARPPQDALAIGGLLQQVAVGGPAAVGAVALALGVAADQLGLSIRPVALIGAPELADLVMGAQLGGAVLVETVEGAVWAAVEVRHVAGADDLRLREVLDDLFGLDAVVLGLLWRKGVLVPGVLERQRAGGVGRRYGQTESGHHQQSEERTRQAHGGRFLPRRRRADAGPIETTTGRNPSQ